MKKYSTSEGGIFSRFFQLSQTPLLPAKIGERDEQKSAKAQSRDTIGANYVKGISAGHL
jgi:hypothetical protein